MLSYAPLPPSFFLVVVLVSIVVTPFCLVVTPFCLVVSVIIVDVVLPLLLIIRN